MKHACIQVHRLEPSFRLPLHLSSSLRQNEVSDGQSIRLGSNWVASVEQALRSAAIMFVFVSPNSLQSPWLYFETGHAYSKGISVVPVGLFGVDIGHLPPPINLLQGFNVTDAESLNNLIAEANEVFRFSHRPGFAPSDFTALTEGGGAGSAIGLLGQHAAIVREVHFDAETEGADLDELTDCLKSLHGFTNSTSGLLVSGAKITLPGHDPRKMVHAQLDPFAALEVFECTERGFRKMLRQTETSGCVYGCNIMFEEHVRHEHEPYRQLSRLGTGVTVADQSVHASSHLFWLRWAEIDFTFSTSFGFPNRPVHTFLVAKTSASSFYEARLGELIDLLFDRGVLGYGEI